jgi:hypothetical protein
MISNKELAYGTTRALAVARAVPIPMHIIGKDGSMRRGIGTQSVSAAAACAHTKPIAATCTIVPPHKATLIPDSVAQAHSSSRYPVFRHKHGLPGSVFPLCGLRGICTVRRTQWYPGCVACQVGRCCPGSSCCSGWRCACLSAPFSAVELRAGGCALEGSPPKLL